MTIIETMLQKTKAQRLAAQPATQGASPIPLGHPSAIPLAHAPMPLAHAVPEPSVEPLHPYHLGIDQEAARQNRLLISGVPEDRGAMAAYGMLRTRLLQRTRAHNWSVIGVTSPAPRDGKSLTVVNLALSMARENTSTVVLLDCDLCNPSVCHLLGIAPPVELHEYFLDDARDPSELFVTIGVDRLILAGNTLPVDDSAELLASPRTKELLDFIRRRVPNPFILIDLPPLLSPADALVVAPRVDALLLVASEGSTPRTELNKALAIAAGFPIAGLVLNCSTEKRGKYTYDYGYRAKSLPRG